MTTLVSVHFNSFFYLRLLKPPYEDTTNPKANLLFMSSTPSSFKTYVIINLKQWSFYTQYLLHFGRTCSSPKVISGQAEVLKSGLIFTHQDRWHHSIAITTTNEMLDKSWAQSIIQSQTSRSFVPIRIEQFRTFGVNTNLFFKELGLKRNYMHHYYNHNQSPVHEQLGEKKRSVNPNLCFSLWGS